jgi:hypothetical protein
MRPRLPRLPWPTSSAASRACPGSVLQDRLVSRDMKKLLILAVLVALGVVVAKRLRSV